MFKPEWLIVLFGANSSASDPNPTLTTPTLDLDAASDTGSSSTDNYTGNNTPNFTATFDALLTNDKIYMNDNGSAVNLGGVGYHLVTAPEAAGTSIALGMTAFSDGLHSLQIKRVSGTDFSAFSTPLDVTIDTSAPNVSSVVGASTGTGTASISFSTNQTNGTAYYVISAGSTPTPTQVKAGQDSASAAASFAGNQAISASGTKTDSATGLGTATDFLYVMHEDKAGNQSSVVASSSWSQTGSLTSDEYITRSGLTGADATNYRTLIDGLAADSHSLGGSVWSHLDHMLITAAPDTTTMVRNLVGNFANGTNHGMSLTANSYISGNGSTQYLDTGFNPTTVAGNFTQNSASIGVYVTDNDTTGSLSVLVGASITGDGIATQIIPRYNVDGHWYSNLNENGGSTNQNFGNASVQGNWVLSRTAASGAGAVSVYKNSSGTPVTTGTGATSGIANQTFLVAARHVDGTTIDLYSTNHIAAVWFGSKFTSADAVKIMDRLNTFMTAYGHNVY